MTGMFSKTNYYQKVFFLPQIRTPGFNNCLASISTFTWAYPVFLSKSMKSSIARDFSTSAAIAKMTDDDQSSIGSPSNLNQTTVF